MPELDLLLVNPGGQKHVYQSLASSLTAFEPPIWASLMATYTRRRGYAVELIDANALGLSPEEVAAEIAERAPRLVAIVVYGHQPSASTQHMPAASAIAAAIKAVDPARPVLLVGGHVAALPERTLREEKADFVCRGEGLVTLTELVDALKAGGDVSRVPDLLYRDGDAIRVSKAAAPLVKDLDIEMPGLAWDMLPMERYRAHNWHCFGDMQRQPYASIYTTLGCPYHCSFCCIQAPFKSGEKASGLTESINSYRYWSPKAVVDQIGLLVEKYGVKNIKIADEMFVLSPKHVGGICDLLIERGYDLNIWAYARVDTVRDDMVDKLRKAGFTWLAFGIEAASERVRKDVDKAFDQEDIFATLAKVRGAGINVIANYIFGLPEDDLASMQETLDLALEVNAEFANMYCTMAYPGSPLYDMALREKWALPETWTGYSQHAVNSLPLPTKHLPAAEVLRFRDQAFMTYFKSPRYLDMIGAKFGPATVAHLREMTSVQLERQLTGSRPA
jgi:anaerobic magnesium-protoporphyrin IX monomethyl ester cyclase